MVSARVLAGRACSFDTLSFSPQFGGSLFSKATGRIRFADVLHPIKLRDRSGVRPEARSSGRVFRFLLNLDSHAPGIPIGFVFQHRPGDHRDLASQSDRCLLLACLLATVNAIVGGSSPGVVLQTDPGTFQQHRSQETRAAFGDPAVAVCFS